MLEPVGRVRITKIPYGPSIPQEVRESWVGVELPALKISDGTEEQDLVTGDELAGRGQVYVTSKAYAVAALAEKSPGAADWFRENIKIGRVEGLSFGADEVEVIS